MFNRKDATSLASSRRRDDLLASSRRRDNLSRYEDPPAQQPAWLQYHAYFRSTQVTETARMEGLGRHVFSTCEYDANFNVRSPHTGSIYHDEIEHKPFTFPDYIARTLAKHAPVAEFDVLADAPPTRMVDGWAYTSTYLHIAPDVPTWQVEWVDNPMSFVHSTNAYIHAGQFALRAHEMHAFSTEMAFKTSFKQRPAGPISSMDVNATAIALHDDAVRLILRYLVFPTSQLTGVVSALKRVSRQFYRVVWELLTHVKTNGYGQSLSLVAMPNAHKLLEWLATPFGGGGSSSSAAAAAADTTSTRSTHNNTHRLLKLAHASKFTMRQQQHNSSPQRSFANPLYNLRHLDISRCDFKQVGRALVHYASSLQTLVIGRAVNATQEQLIKWCSGLTCLRSLSLSRCDELKDIRKLVPHLSKLASLSINSCHFLGQEAVDAIFEHCTALERLDIGRLGAPVTAVRPVRLTNLVALHMESLRDLQWRDDAVDLRQCVNLRFLDVSRQSLLVPHSTRGGTDGTFTQIRQLTNLEALVCIDVDITAHAHMQTIMSLPKLRFLHLGRFKNNRIPQHNTLAHHMLTVQRGATVIVAQVALNALASYEPASHQYWTPEVTVREADYLSIRYSPTNDPNAPMDAKRLLLGPPEPSVSWYIKPNSHNGPPDVSAGMLLANDLGEYRDAHLRYGVLTNKRRMRDLQ